MRSITSRFKNLPVWGRNLLVLCALALFIGSSLSYGGCRKARVSFEREPNPRYEEPEPTPEPEPAPELEEVMLTIDSPTDGQIVDAPSVEIRGKTEQGALVFVNDEITATVDPATNVYRVVVNLEEGENSFVIGARKEGMKTKTIEITVTRPRAPPPPPPQPVIRFVGSVNSNVYHYPSCYYVRRIYPENLVGFVSAQEGQSYGYRPCKVCRPPG